MLFLLALIEAAKNAKHVHTVVIPGNPTPASRPRVTRWGVYYGKHYTNWRKDAEAFTPPGSLDIPSTAPLLVCVECIVARPKTSKRTFPGGDCDNYVKGPLDVITKAEGYWHDDEQIVHLFTSKRFAGPNEDPRTIIEIYRL